MLFLVPRASFGPGQKGLSMKKNLKKLLAAILALTMVLGMTACGNEKTNIQDGTEPSEQVQQIPNPVKCT